MSDPAASDPIDPSSPPASQGGNPTLLEHYRHYQARLLRLNRGNRSVLLRRTSGQTVFDLHICEAAKPGTLDKIASACIATKETTVPILSDKVDDHDAQRASLTKLDRKIRLIEEETGQQIGYVGFPFLEGRIGEGVVRGPMALFAVSLERKKDRATGWYVKLLDQGPVLNIALIKAIERLSGKKNERIDDKFDDLMDEIGDKRLTYAETLGVMAGWIEDLLDIDPSNRLTEPSPIEKLTKEDTDGELWPLRVASRMAVGIFPQGDVNMFGDYEDLMKGVHNDTGGIAGDLLGFGDVVDGDGDGSEHEHLDMDRVKARDLNIVLPSDASQSEVIVVSKSSPLVAVKGPPGTGKSQLIVNMVADALSHGQKVVVVCQKRAALEVVHKRLAAVGLDECTVLMTKESDDRRSVYARMRDAIDRSYGWANSNPTAPASSRLLKISEEIDSATDSLRELVASMAATHTSGARVHDLYCTAKSGYRALKIPAIDSLVLTRDELEERVNWVRERSVGCKKYDTKGHALYGRKSLEHSSPQDRARLGDLLTGLIDAPHDAAVCASRREQEELHKIVDSWGQGMMWKLRKGGKIKAATKLMARSLDETDIKGETRRVNEGLSWWDCLDGVCEFFDTEMSDSLRNAADTEDHSKALWESMAVALREFDAIQEHDIARAKASKQMNAVLDGLLVSDTDGDWGEILRQEVYLRWITEVEAENPSLHGTPMERYARERCRLAEAIKSQRDAVRDEIIESSHRSIHMPKKYARNMSDEEASWKEFAREVSKKRRAKPVRVLFETHSSKFLGIAPCWLMSPEVACRIMPLKRGLVDVVIMDEASQLAVERALPVLYRAKRAVIAGDDKQLQPFDLFEVRDDEEDVALPEEKSLLDMAYATLSPQFLSWHYRSKYQELIDFSNHAFYAGGLNVSPNMERRPQPPPIEWIPCSGATWSGRKNPVEAKLVAEQVRCIWKKARGKIPSIAVITFNDEQQALIMDVIDSMRYDDEEFGHLYDLAEHDSGNGEHLIVKNIENVQGDERDVVVFSIGYAKDADGKFSNFFGTLSARGGENRLNVAITRARKSMVVVSSIDPTDIKPTSTNDGPRLLRKFLEYAKATGTRDADSKRDILASLGEHTTRRSGHFVQMFESPFEEKVARALEQRGYTVATQVGVSGYRIDLAVANPNDDDAYVLGIECDGAMFHSARSARERDVLRQEFLESKGWKIERIWSRDWWRNPVQEIDRIDSRIKELVAAHERDAQSTGQPGEN